jgi:hypothetical protein
LEDLMKTRILLLVVAIISAGCATSSNRYPAAARNGGGGRPESPPAPRNQGPARTQGTVMAPHPGPIAQAPGRHDGDHPVAVNNPPHQVQINRNEPPRSVVDNRAPSGMSHDPHARVMVRNRNFRPIPEWNRYHPVIRVGYDNAWWGVWGIQSWDTVGTVTCEAANASTGELYPVTMERDRNGWDDPSVDTVLDQALADCSEEAQVEGDAVNPCVPASPACSFETWDGSVYRTN